jgi:hypothetical protein
MLRGKEFDLRPNENGRREAWPRLSKAEQKLDRAALA